MRKTLKRVDKCRHKMWEGSQLQPRRSNLEMKGIKSIKARQAACLRNL